MTVVACRIRGYRMRGDVNLRGENQLTGQFTGGRGISVTSTSG